jgi:hypothetical protein
MRTDITHLSSHGFLLSFCPIFLGDEYKRIPVIADYFTFFIQMMMVRLV